MRCCVRLAALAFLAWTGSATAQVNNEAYRDYFLFGRFGEVCTMCEITVVCTSGKEAPAEDALPQSGDYTLYHLQTRTFWSQVSTIWEWFVSNFSSDSLAARGHTRPVYRYDISAGVWSARQVEEARLVLEPPLLEFGAVSIDRVTRQWSDADGVTQGFCARLPLWDTLAVIGEQAGETS